MIFISLLLFMLILIPFSIYKWSVNFYNHHFFLILALPVVILFEIGLINKYKKAEIKIRLLKNEIKNRNNRSYDSLFYKRCNEFKLTKREIQVTQLLIIGKEAKEISSNLNIAYNTVRNFKQKIYEKLNVKNTVELVNFFIKIDK